MCLEDPSSVPYPPALYCTTTVFCKKVVHKSISYQKCGGWGEGGGLDFGFEAAHCSAQCEVTLIQVSSTLQQCGDDLNREGHNYSVRGRLIAAYNAATLTAAAYNSTMCGGGGKG